MVLEIQARVLASLFVKGHGSRNEVVLASKIVVNNTDEAVKLFRTVRTGQQGFVRSEEYAGVRQSGS